MQLGDTLMAIEGPIRLSVFAVMLIALVTWELTAPRRRQDIPRVLRWTNNIALVVVDTLILRLTFPVLAVGFAVHASAKG
ncbi:MAG: sterol desaturase family protein, partial [Rhodobacteraceae bacterium]|nr:sterol desaturase family protein [Paracoccaceae bacterium]